MKKLLFILLAGLLITSCSDDTELYAPINGDEIIVVDEGKNIQSLKPNPHLNGVAVTRPMKVKGSGILEYIYPWDECGMGNEFVEVFGTGKATHLGKFDHYLSYCRSIEEENPVTLVEGYLMAANGDVLNTHLRINDDGTTAEGEDEIGFYLIFDFDGGTGRFEEAEGWVKLYFIFDIDERPTIYSNFGEGELAY
jgi:hypothetical protein